MLKHVGSHQQKNMKPNFGSKFSFFNSRALIAFTFSSVGLLLGMLAFGADLRSETTASASSSAHSTFVVKSSVNTSSQAPSTNGSWSIVASPNSTTSDSLFSVTCSSTSDCWAVGGQNGLIEHWNGTQWTIASTTGNSNTEFYGVACASASTCWAVGYNYDGSVPVIERWNGTSWTMIPTPNVGTTVLTAVTCAGSSDCWAAGYDAPPSSPPQTVVDHWNGTAWVIFASANTRPTDWNFLASVTCTSSSNCWAVGQYFDGNSAGYYKTLTEHWNGTAWGIVPSPNQTANPIASGQLFGVTCNSASDCWAVGEYTNLISGTYNSPTLIERWDGNAWSIVPSPNVSSVANNSLNSVACTSPSQCWAVGTLDNGGTPTQFVGALLEQWDGTSWSIASWPGYALLWGVTCIAGPECWAVGWNGNGSGGSTVIGHYPTPTVAFFAAQVPVGNGVYYLQFPNGRPFGYYSYLADPHWIYHFDMGYEYWIDANDAQGGIFFYDFASGHFFYTSPTFGFPYLYDFTLNTVLYYYPDPGNPGHYTTNPRYFFNFATGQIITM